VTCGMARRRDGGGLAGLPGLDWAGNSEWADFHNDDGSRSLAKGIDAPISTAMRHGGLADA
jgi:hypothetical protein